MLDIPIAAQKPAAEVRPPDEGARELAQLARQSASRVRMTLPPLAYREPLQREASRGISPATRRAGESKHALRPDPQQHQSRSTGLHANAATRTSKMASRAL